MWCAAVCVYSLIDFYNNVRLRCFVRALTHPAHWIESYGCSKRTAGNLWLKLTIHHCVDIKYIEDGTRSHNLLSHTDFEKCDFCWNWNGKIVRPAFRHIRFLMHSMCNKSSYFVHLWIKVNKVLVVKRNREKRVINYNQNLSIEWRWIERHGVDSVECRFAPSWFYSLRISNRSFSLSRRLTRVQQQLTLNFYNNRNSLFFFHRMKSATIQWKTFQLMNIPIFSLK